MDEKEDEGSSTNGAVIFVIILLVLLIIAGVLLFVFRKRLNLAEKCKTLGAKCKCCNKKGSVTKLTPDPDESARDPMKGPMRVSFKEDQADSNDVEKAKKEKEIAETAEMAKNLQALKSYHEDEERKNI